MQQTIVLLCMLTLPCLLQVKKGAWSYFPAGGWHLDDFPLSRSRKVSKAHLPTMQAQMPGKFRGDDASVQMAGLKWR
jgi:hypothetical protein